MPGTRSHRAVVSALSFALALIASPRIMRAQPTACALVTAAEAKSLVGSAAAGTPAARGCRWGVAGQATRQLILITYTMPAAQQEMAWAGMQRSAQASGHAVTQEPGVGGESFSVAESFGVVMMIREKGGMVQLQFHVAHDGAATSAERDALRAVAKSVASRM